jgi:glyoxylase-like metal-dependent hydrolase (beta-lactamase superfamily II)
VVPKSLWGPQVPPDAQNRVLCANHCLLARDGRHHVLVDTGCGTKFGPLDRRYYDLEPGDPLLESLAALGVAPEDIDTVVFSHLHFDHAGGATRYDRQRQLAPTFPNARHIVGRIEWNDAIGGSPELQTAYSPHNLLPLKDLVPLVLLDDGAEISPGLTVRVTGGHTRGHMAIVFQSNGQGMLYPGDLCPTTAHIRRCWCTAYDVNLVRTRHCKPLLLGEAADRDWVVIWNHDAHVAASRVQRHPKREFVVCDPQPRL